ncbi:MAG: nicotinate (nicotinamide) nucleotide adenylyltransferase [Spirochaetaceae bacterium]|nr:nicotinate (nicotinamide) nucleotide adenylyltransferase [Spirochaetaceae bacterium]
MKLAILGGSFDPVHNGHLHIARAALRAGYDRLILIPAYQSPFKTRSQAGSAEIRIRMLLAAIGNDRHLTVDTSEVDRKGISYTIDTIKDIIERYVPEGKPGLLIGDDLVHDFEKWEGAKEIARLANIIIARRLNNVEEPFPFPHTNIQNEIVTAASCNLREMIKTGGGWQELVTPAVRDIIIENKLYTEVENLVNSDIPPKNVNISLNGVLPAATKPARNSFAVVQQTAFAMLDTSRYLHSRNVALHCADLCERYGLDPEKGYLAGIAHDMCKRLTTEEFFRMAGMDGEPFTAIEQQKPGMLHGRAAAMLLQTIFCIDDHDILDAVRWHTTGKPGMSALAKIVYLTDKIEMGRHTVERRLRELAFGADTTVSLDDLFNTVLRATADWLLRRGLILAPETVELLDAVR